EQMPLHDSGDRIELRPAEVRGADEVTADDAHAHLRGKSGNLRLERHAIAEEEVQSAAHTAARPELALEARHARRELGRRSAAPHSFGVEEDLDALLRGRGCGEQNKE